MGNDGGDDYKIFDYHFVCSMCSVEGSMVCLLVDLMGNNMMAHVMLSLAKTFFTLISSKI